MTEYQLHWWPAGAKQAMTSTVNVPSESHLRGAALALKHFLQAGCDITTPLAHIDLTDPDGVKQTLLVEEVLNWLSNPTHRGFITQEGLSGLVNL